MDSETTTLAYEMIARIVRPLLTSEDIAHISRMEGGDDIQFSAETSGRMAEVDAHVSRLLQSNEAHPMVNAYDRGAEELKRNAEDSEDDESEGDESESAAGETLKFQNWKAIRDKQQSIAAELAMLVGIDFNSRNELSTQLDQRKLNIIARYLQALLLEEKRRRR